MGNVVELKPPTNLADNVELIVDMCRFSEGLLTEKQVKKKWRFDNTTWEAAGADEALVEKIEAESCRRIRDGSAKREKSQQLIVKGPAILDGIASDVSASPRHQIDAIRTLDTFAANGPQGAPAADRFLIQINIGEDTLTFNKSIARAIRGNVAKKGGEGWKVGQTLVAKGFSPPTYVDHLDRPGEVGHISAPVALLPLPRQLFIHELGERLAAPAQ